MAIEIHQHSNRKYIFKWWIFHCYVSLPEGNVVFSALQIGTLRLGHLFLNNTGRMKFEELDSFGRRMNFPIDNISMYKFNTDIIIYIYSIYTTYNIDTHTHTLFGYGSITAFHLLMLVLAIAKALKKISRFKLLKGSDSVGTPPHQDYAIFCREIPINLHLWLLLGWE